MPLLVWSFFVLLLFAASSALCAAPKINLRLQGPLSQAESANIRAHVSINQLDPNQALSDTMLEYHYSKAAEEAAIALQPFGYYHPKITLNKTKQADAWLVEMQIEPGERVRISKVEIDLAEPGKSDAELQRLVASFGMREGDVLDHRRYEQEKLTITEAAIDKGYLRANWRGSKVTVRRHIRSAVMRLHVDSGPRYTVGRLLIDSKIMDEALLTKISPLQPGDPLSPRGLTSMRQSLYDSKYFASVDVDYDLDKAKPGHKVDLQLRVTPNLQHKYALGLGYGTDTGGRATLNYSNRYLNRAGHQLDLELRPSQRLSRFGGVYTIPIGDPNQDRLFFSSKYQTEKFSGTESTLWLSGITREHYWANGDLGAYLNLLDEDYTTGLEGGHASMLIPGLKGSIFWADSRIKTTRGIRLHASLAGSKNGFLSDTSFMQASLGVKGIYSFLDVWRFIMRGDVSTTWTDEFRDLPPSLRLYAGGDQSVRGYGYKQISPRDEAGNLIGGKHRLTSSLELERRIFDSWGAAVFYDSGAVMNQFSDLNLKAGLGAGIRWYAPFGQMRFDIATPLDEAGFDKLRIHFSLGADL